MSKIEFNIFYSDEEVFLANIMDKLVKEKKNSITWSIKNGDIERYNKIDYLSTKEEVDKK